MEILDLFEERIHALIAEVQDLRVENEILQDELTSCRLVIDEHKVEISGLVQEQQNSVEVRQRIEALLNKIQLILPE